MGRSCGSIAGTIKGLRSALPGTNKWTGTKNAPLTTRANIDIPDGYIAKPSKKGNGTLYSDPNNPHNSMRVMPGNPNSPNSAQQNPYVIYKVNGISYDVNGLPLPNANTPAAHIPLRDFNLKVMPKF